ncbi:MAG TPA: hypothetical protein VNH11_33015 [Pirellulales bacterium]|nr:hypothetical protein [Pirellulales bacterium]
MKLPAGWLGRTPTMTYRDRQAGEAGRKGAVALRANSRAAE